MINFPIDLLKLIDILPFLDIFKRKYVNYNYDIRGINLITISLLVKIIIIKMLVKCLHHSFIFPPLYKDSFDSSVLIIHFETFTTNIPLTETLLSFELLYHGK